MAVDLAPISDKVYGLLDRDKVVVIDEFQRMGEDILEAIVV